MWRDTSLISDGGDAIAMTLDSMHVQRTFRVNKLKTNMTVTNLKVL